LTQRRAVLAILDLRWVASRVVVVAVQKQETTIVVLEEGFELNSSSS
jgi:hypothetical protein